MPVLEQQTQPDSIFQSACVGFPSPADDYLHRPLDLNDHLVPRPHSTFFIKVTGNALAGEKIFDGDILIVDRSADIAAGQIVIAAREGEFLLRKIMRQGRRFYLITDDPGCTPIEVDESCQIWGRVMWTIRKFSS